MPLPARLIDSAVALAGAALVRTRELAVRPVLALLATMFGATKFGATNAAPVFAQAALLLLVLSPFLEQVIAIETLAAAIVLSLGVIFAAAIEALLPWKNMHRIVSRESHCWRVGTMPSFQAIRCQRGPLAPSNFINTERRGQ